MMRRAPRLRSARWILCLPVLALCGMVVVAGSAGAQPQPSTRSSWPEVLTLEQAAGFLQVSPGELGQLAEWGQVPARRVGAHWRFPRTALLEWLKGDAVASATPFPAANRRPAVRAPDPYYASLAASMPGAKTLPRGAMAQARARGTGVAQAAPPPTPAEQPEPIGEPPEEKTAEDVFLRGQRVLLTPGEITLELGLFYSRSDDQAFASTAAGVVLGTIEQDTFTSTFTGRYGLFTDTELFASIPFRRQTSQTFSGSQEISSTVVNEFGDVRLGLRRSVLREGLGVPEIIVTADGRIPTHESSYAVGGGIALVKSVDPAVLFANVNYRHTFSRDFSDVTRLAARNRIDASAGFAFALNDTLTLSTAVSGVFASETDFTNATLRNQESFSLQFGLTSLLTEGLYIEPTVSFALNGTGNDVVLGVSLPYSFTP